MHTAILLAVHADDARSAVEEVEQFNEYNAHWSDWNEHGGRWQHEIPNAVICYKDHPELFMETVKKFQNFRDKAIASLLEEIKDVSVKELVTEPKYRLLTDGMRVHEDPNAKLTEEEHQERLDNSLTLWRARRLLQLIENDFQPDQHFYDIAYHSANSWEMEKRCEAEPEKQFIVVWDYHY